MSHEEQIFEWWCEEAKEYGLIESYKMQPCKFDVVPRYASGAEWIECSKKPINHKKLTIGPWTYTPDFLLMIHTESIIRNYFLSSHNDLYACVVQVYIDTKGTRETADQTRLFKLKQLMMWHTHEIYVNRIRVKYFLQYTWTPRKALGMPDRSKYITVSTARSIEEFIHEIQ